ncbi:hypothetical protein ACFL6W_03630 [Thermodesulfobacteriota bacterium]
MKKIDPNFKVEMKLHLYLGRGLEGIGDAFVLPDGKMEPFRPTDKSNCECKGN